MKKRLSMFGMCWWGGEGREWGVVRSSFFEKKKTWSQAFSAFSVLPLVFIAGDVNLAVFF